MKTNKDAMDAVLRGVKEVIDPAFTYKGHTEEWVYYIDTAALDMFDGNRKNIVERSFTPTSVRYVRLYVISPTQGFDQAARIYELGLY